MSRHSSISSGTPSSCSVVFHSLNWITSLKRGCRNGDAQGFTLSCSNMSRTCSGLKSQSNPIWIPTATRTQTLGAMSLVLAQSQTRCLCRHASLRAKERSKTSSFVRIWNHPITSLVLISLCPSSRWSPARALLTDPTFQWAPRWTLPPSVSHLLSLALLDVLSPIDHAILLRAGLFRSLLSVPSSQFSQVKMIAASLLVDQVRAALLV